jgi:hypothetical protein
MARDSAGLSRGALFHTHDDEMGMDEGLSRMFFFTTLRYAVLSFLSILYPL